MRQSTFRIDFGLVMGPYSGYTDGQQWNGWAWPYFTRAVADQIMADFPGASYHARSDCYRFPYEDANGDVQDIYVVAGEDHVVDGVPVRLYPIGAGEWTWDDAAAWPSKEEQRVHEPA
jgi:hypothetical protein